MSNTNDTTSHDARLTAAGALATIGKGIHGVGKLFIFAGAMVHPKPTEKAVIEIATGSNNQQQPFDHLDASERPDRNRFNPDDENPFDGLFDDIDFGDDDSDGGDDE